MCMGIVCACVYMGKGTYVCVDMCKRVCAWLCICMSVCMGTCMVMCVLGMSVHLCVYGSVCEKKAKTQKDRGIERESNKRKI